MSCSLTLQKFLPRGLRGLSESDEMLPSVKLLMIERVSRLRRPIRMQLGRYKASIYTAGALFTSPGSSALHFLLHAIGEFITLMTNHPDDKAWLGTAPLLLSSGFSCLAKGGGPPLGHKPLMLILFWGQLKVTQLSERGTDIDVLI